MRSSNRRACWALTRAMIDFAGMFESFEDGIFGDGVEGHAFDIGLWRKNLRDVPGDCFSFAVRVGREVDDIAFFGSFFKLGDHFFFIGQDSIFGLEIMFDIDAKFFFRQIANMSN